MLGTPVRQAAPQALAEAVAALVERLPPEDLPGALTIVAGATAALGDRAALDGVAAAATTAIDQMARRHPDEVAGWYAEALRQGIAIVVAGPAGADPSPGTMPAAALPLAAALPPLPSRKPRLPEAAPLPPDLHLVLVPPIQLALACPEAGEPVVGCAAAPPGGVTAPPAPPQPRDNGRQARDGAASPPGEDPPSPEPAEPDDDPPDPPGGGSGGDSPGGGSSSGGGDGGGGSGTNAGGLRDVVRDIVREVTGRLGNG
jgi:hypothetical protein